nr:MAG TPA: hypothetical protein [Caudoviricetes sp.]
MKYSELIRILIRNGCELKRHGKEHDVWANPKTGNFIAIPRHNSKEVPKPFLNKVKRELL